MLRRSPNNNNKKSSIVATSNIKSPFSAFSDADVLRLNKTNEFGGYSSAFSIPQEQELDNNAGRSSFHLQPKPGQDQDDNLYCRPVVVPIRVHNGHDDVVSPSSPKLPKKLKTIMCENLSDCKYHKRTGQCHFAHSRDELRRFTLQELKQHKSGSGDEEYECLSHPCLYAVSLGNW